MKKLFAISFLTILLFSPQKASAFLLDFGVVGGGGFSKFAGDTGTSIGPLSFFGGATVQFSLPMLGIEADFLYSVRNFDGVVDNTTLKSIEVPIVAKLSAGPLHFGGGIFYGFGIGEIAGQSYELAGFSKSNFGLVLLAGLSLPVGVYADARYSMGLKDMRTNALLSSKTHYIDLVLGYKF